MATLSGVVREIEATNAKLDVLINVMRRLLYEGGIFSKPKSLPEPEPIDERYDGMAHFIKNRQHLAPVPTGKGIVKQELHVLEDGVEILPWTPVAFDPATGAEQAPLPTYWAEVDKTVTREARYTRDDGSVSDIFTTDYVQVDNFTGPMVSPADLAEVEQIDETDSDTRPTT